MNKKYKMSAKQWRTMYAQRGPKGLTYVELYYESPEVIRVDHKMNMVGKLLMLLAFPLLVIITLIVHGLKSFPDIKSEAIELYSYMILNKPFDTAEFYPRHDKHWDIISGIVGEYSND